MAAKIKRGDRVIVVAGRDKGKTGQVLRVAVSYTHLTLPTKA